MLEIFFNFLNNFYFFITVVINICNIIYAILYNQGETKNFNNITFNIGILYSYYFLFYIIYIKIVAMK